MKAKLCMTFALYEGNGLPFIIGKEGGYSFISQGIGDIGSRYMFNPDKHYLVSIDADRFNLYEIAKSDTEKEVPLIEKE